MPNHYLLPCSDCDHQFQLTATQAGQTLQCPQCEAQLEAPKLGTLKQLPTEGKPLPIPSAGSAGSGWRRPVFAVGLAIAILTGSAGIALYSYSQSLYTPVDIEGHISRAQQKIDNMSPAQLWDLWYAQDLEGGLGEWAEPKHLRYNKQSTILNKIAYGLLGLAGIGLVTMLSSFMMKH